MPQRQADRHRGPEHGHGHARRETDRRDDGRDSGQAGPVERVLHPIVDPKAEKKTTPLAKGLPAGPGGACGQLSSPRPDAVDWAAKGEKVILVREETNPEDVEGMRRPRAS